MVLKFKNEKLYRNKNLENYDILKNKIKRIQEFKRKQSKYIIFNFDFTTTKEIMLPRWRILSLIINFKKKTKSNYY